MPYALFVSFFPQLVAGPIVRAREFLPQCLSPRAANARQIGWGLSPLVIGLFEKVVLADSVLAPIADSVFRAAEAAGTLDAWVGTFAFSCQIFFDFAGYSSCAIGTAMCLGFEMPENFNCPYAARGFSDFWRRWHISLSIWLRDYLYIPLGGNRRGQARTYLNVMITMLLGGLCSGMGPPGISSSGEPFMGSTSRWKGVSGAALRQSFAVRGTLLPLLAGLGTFGIVSVTWVFFRAESMESVLQLLETMFTGRESSLVDASQSAELATVLIGTLLAHTLLRDADLERSVARAPLWLRSTVLAMMMCALILAPGDDRAFIYFQF